MQVPETELVHIVKMAQELRVPIQWLRAEAEANRIPHIKAGKILLFNPASVKQNLASRAKGDKIRAS